MPLLEKRAGAFRFSWGEVGEANVGNKVGDWAEDGAGVVGIADGGRPLDAVVEGVFLGVLMYSGVAPAGFLCNVAGFFAGIGGTLNALFDLVLSCGGEFSIVDDRCRFRLLSADEEVPTAVPPAPVAKCAFEYRLL